MQLAAAAAPGAQTPIPIPYQEPTIRRSTGQEEPREPAKQSPEPTWCRMPSRSKSVRGGDVRLASHTGGTAPETAWGRRMRMRRRRRRSRREKTRVAVEWKMVHCGAVRRGVVQCSTVTAESAEAVVERDRQDRQTDRQTEKMVRSSVLRHVPSRARVVPYCRCTLAVLYGNLGTPAPTRRPWHLASIAHHASCILHPAPCFPSFWRGLGKRGSRVAAAAAAAKPNQMRLPLL
ncbi:hypothetical protein K431DRAFT_29802 [Polychaeton citri CBS 116435]|uniref:Uncharacterized protein n=1 Tax=Polychaeton citri CBS 116435 TaxID=1314669 RepID=A0A9P4Q067_9PEZI|nr:hypothetical protein K431DRAFT_29802 [Polychaeton citri CBS 116435]